MEPMVPKTEDLCPPRPGGAPEFHGMAGYPAQPKLVPTMIVWSHGGSEVAVEGSFDNWTNRQTLQQSGKNFTVVKLLPPGVYQYKFIVDGEWKYDPNQAAMYDEIGNVNNVLEVHEFVPENIGGVSGFDPPPSPPSSYNNLEPCSEDYSKEPPQMPPHLQLALLNVPQPIDTQQALPRPWHVILNHMYVQKGSPNVNALVLGTTHRYKSKYITTLLYKPKRTSPQEQEQLDEM
ncbi:unnamed protein product [Ostreobium quekettii]|uniref:Association with the SNF1 complex (ASC) domain-containing protein n=1 Tax=Ostreobium quekettii TaxID=121088 RepID=A0A8S1IPT3_9CHLO|nr:unnamed protein product [Ostreobium quekettii]|eukprot:evm.model.scf_121.5 EVM.evm.TU.scf_121.5   scf_121:43315-48688(+)